jgi:Rrf2 family protein
MKVSKRTRYAVRLMAELARNYNNGPLSVADIARRENISEKFLEQIIMPLRAMGPIVSVRGPQGGYMLSKPPAEIALKTVVDLFEGTSGVVECVNNRAVCGRSGFCMSRDVWVKVQERIDETLNSMTLEDLIGPREDTDESFPRRKSAHNAETR